MPVIVKGLQEVVRGFNRIQRSTSREIQRELKKAAEPVANAGKAKISRYAGASVNTIRPRAAGASVFVTQGARKVTGLRGDFGGVQQRRLMEALDEHAGEVESGVEKALDRLTSTF